MNQNALETYLGTFATELRKRGPVQSRIVDEAREHLVDAIESGERRGLGREAATQEALDRFGSPQVVATTIFKERYRVLHRVLLTLAGSLGIVIAYVDSRPTWDDTGVTALSMLLSAGVFGFAGPQRPWAWALAIGIWIALHQIRHAPTLGSVAGCLVILSFPLSGAYIGQFCRRTCSRISG